MKNAVLLLLLVPFFAFSQTTLVRWRGFNGSNVATAYDTHVTGGNISATGAALSIDTWNGFQTSNWPTANNLDANTYVQLTVAPTTGYQLSLSALNFQYNAGDQGARKITIRYSTNADFSDYQTLWDDQTLITSSTTDKSISFSSLNVGNGKTLYIRIYGYKRNNASWTGGVLQFNHVDGNGTIGSGLYAEGIAITGTATLAAGVVANPDSATTFAGQPVTVTVLTNDTATSTTISSVAVQTQPTHGAAAPSGTQIIYTPTNNTWSGTDSFTYKITGASGATSTATVTVTVNALVAPTAATDTATLLQSTNTAINVLSNDTSGSGAFSNVAVFTNPAHGTALLQANNTILYTPVTSYSGTDSFTYKYTNTYGSTATGTVNITVNPLIAPTVGNDSATTFANTSVNINVLSNDTSSGSGTFTSITIFTNPAHGTATVQANNTITYNPTTGYSGADTFVYKYTNSYGSTTNGTVSITVNPLVAPTAGADTATTVKNTSTTITVLSNDTTGTGTLTGVAVTTAAAHGTATVLANNTITYVPATDYTGTDSFGYTLTNSYGLTATATVSITVNQPAIGTSPLNGTYVIGTAAQYAYPQFTSITAAVAALNSNGISGAVTFLLKDTAYTNTTESFPITINAITNSSVVNTVTFKPYNGVTTKIVATNVNGYTGVPAVFYLNGADYITFDGSNATGGSTRNLTIDNQDAIDYIERTVIWVASNGSNGATNITVKNCNIKQSYKNQGGKFCVGLYVGNNGIGTNNTMVVSAATANNSTITAKNNDFTNVKQGVYINGGSTLTTNIIIHGNDLGASNNNETIISPATFSNVNGFEYTENYVNNLYRNTDDGNLISAGVYVTGASKNGTIAKNQMRDITRTVTNNQVFGGIVLASTDTNSNILVANNFILNVAAAGSGGGYLNGYGIVVDNGGGYKIYNNTVSLNTNQPNGGFSAAFYVSANGTNLDVRNNIFANNQTNTATRRTAITIANHVNNINTIFTNLDYNDYSSNDRLGYIANVNAVNQVDWPGNGVQGSYNDNADYTYSLQSWKSITTKDVHSLDIAPAFMSASNLHIAYGNAANANLDNKGLPLTLVTKDYDGQIRSTTTPDMGADEFGAVTMPTAGSTAGIYCDSAVTWNGTQWLNGTPDAGKDVIFSGNYTQTGGTFYACSVFVLNGANVNFISNATAIVTHSVNIDATGTLTFESSSNLIQLENDANSGIATVKRNSSKLKRLDYTMWSAPVYDARTTGFQSLLDFSPLTNLTRFYQYNTLQNLYIDQAPSTTRFAQGQSYLIRMPNTNATTGYNEGLTRIAFPGVFNGTLNNGTIKVALQYTDDAHGFNAVGNPYPSPINATDFINDNINVISGTLWCWRKTNNSAETSYSTINLSGYVANAALGGGGLNGADGNDLIADPFVINPKGALNTAQGFLVKATATDKELTFRNSMRIQEHYNNFFKSATPSSETTEDESAAIQPDRVWLNVKNAAGEYAQVLVAYNPETTLGYDNGYDGESLTGGNIDFYSQLPTETETLNLAIQTRGTFAQSDIVPMGYKATTAGSYEISIDHLDGLFDGNQDVYISDSTEGLVHNLKNSSYTFSTEAGVFDNRFTIVYTPQGALDTDTPVLETKQVMVYRDGKQVKIQSPEDINTVTVYDMTGKTLFQKSNIDGVDFSTSDINAAQQIIIVQITLDNQKVISKKMMMN